MDVQNSSCQRNLFVYKSLRHLLVLHLIHNFYDIEPRHFTTLKYYFYDTEPLFFQLSSVLSGRLKILIVVHVWQDLFLWSDSFIYSINIWRYRLSDNWLSVIILSSRPIFISCICFPDVYTIFSILGNIGWCLHSKQVCSLISHCVCARACVYV